MAIGRIEIDQQEEQKRPLQIITKAIEPVIIASRKFYQTNPKEFLQLGLISFFILVSFVGEMITNLPISWYLVFSLLIIGHFDLINKVKKALKRTKWNHH